MLPQVAKKAAASSATAATDGAGAGQPAKTNTLSVAELNKASAKAGGSWAVHICRPIEDKYEYTWKGGTRHGTKLIVTLVSPENPSHYCQAEFKKTTKNENKFNETKKAMEHGATYIMSKVSFVDDAKRAYISCPFKDVVDLSGSTKMERCAGNPECAVQPAPMTTVAGSSALDGNQFFDITALVLEVEDIRQHPNNRSSFCVMIYDGSLDTKTQKVQVMPVRFYFDTVPATDASGAARPASGEEMKKAIDEHYANKTAMTFFCLSGNRDDGGKFALRNTRHTSVVTAIGQKA